MPVVVSVVSVLIAISLLAFAWKGWARAFLWSTNQTVFMSQMQKLIQANNIDRALKLCNVEPHAALPRVIKVLLVRANRPYSLCLTREEARADLRSQIGSYLHFNLGTLAAAHLGLGTLAFGLSQGQDGWSLWVVQGSLAVSALSAVRIWVNRTRFLKILDDVEMASAKCLDLLYSRKSYHPPQYKTPKMTEAEIQQWRRSMDYVEAEAVKAGSDTAADLHDSMADQHTGILPPL